MNFVESRILVGIPFGDDTANSCVTKKREMKVSRFFDLSETNCF